MHAIVRSYATAGVAVVGASVIPVSPLAPPPTGISTETHVVALAASPFDTYAQVLEAISPSLQLLLNAALGDPPASLPAGVNLQSVLAGLVQDPAGRLQDFFGVLENLPSSGLPIALPLKVFGPLNGA